MIKIDVLAPAKLNLALDITGQTANGFHNVDMIMQTVSLYERVEISKSRGWSLRCPGSLVPTGKKNVATKAAGVFFTETGLLAGADVTLHKYVPTRAGLAGGSADAAAVLMGLNALYGARLPLAELCRMGALVGADVPFLLLGGTARAQGIGELLTPLRPLPLCWFVITMPPAGVSTPLAYQRYDEIGSPTHPNIEKAIQGIEAGELAALAPHMQNALEYANGDETTALLRASMMAQGALASMMTGSGAAVFGMFEKKEAAQQAFDTLLPHFPKTFLAQPVETGPQIIKSV